VIILDTNVVSEAIKAGRSPGVVTWLDEQVAETLYLTSISLSELLIGVEILPAGKRKDRLCAGLGELIVKLFGPRILPFDQQAAVAYAALMGGARAAGKAVSMPDGQIGAIASVHGFAVATRDAAPFMALQLPTINPWKTI